MNYSNGEIVKYVYGIITDKPISLSYIMESTWTALQRGQHCLMAVQGLQVSGNLPKCFMNLLRELLLNMCSLK